MTRSSAWWLRLPTTMSTLAYPWMLRWPCLAATPTAVATTTTVMTDTTMTRTTTATKTTTRTTIFTTSEKGRFCSMADQGGQRKRQEQLRRLLLELRSKGQNKGDSNGSATTTTKATAASVKKAKGKGINLFDYGAHPIASEYAHQQAGAWHDIKCSSVVRISPSIASRISGNKASSAAQIASSTRGGHIEHPRRAQGVVKNGFQARTEIDDNDDDMEYVMRELAAPTIGDAILKALEGAEKGAQKTIKKREKKSWTGKRNSHEDASVKTVCILSHKGYDDDCSDKLGENMICSSTHNDEHEEVPIMIGPGASQTVASSERQSGHGLTTTTATCTVYSSASANPSEDITIIGENIIEATDQNGVVSHAKCQRCRVLGRDKVLASVSRYWCKVDIASSLRIPSLAPTL